jgi:hypothetical protein
MLDMSKASRDLAMMGVSVLMQVCQHVTTIDEMLESTVPICD